MLTLSAVYCIISAEVPACAGNRSDRWSLSGRATWPFPKIAYEACGCLFKTAMSVDAGCLQLLKRLLPAVEGSVKIIAFTSCDAQLFLFYH
jgi:hypothetical protein